MRESACSGPVTQGGYKTRVYHHHLKKCGGSTLNRWLDQQTEDTRCWHPRALAWDWSAPPEEAETLDIRGRDDRLRRLSAAAFHWSDIVHTHAAIGRHARPGTFRFTVLRDPVSRLVSQVADWRRLNDDDLAHSAPSLRTCLVDARRLRLAPFLERHGRGDGRQVLDNYLVRAVAKTRLGLAAELIADARDLTGVALRSLNQDYDLVGLTEQAVATRQALCRRLGWAPAPGVPRVNATGSAASLRDEAAEAAGILAELTAHDRTLYDFARERFGAEDITYDAAAFEAGAASGRLARLRGIWSHGRTLYSVRGPLIGNGWHGRDGAGTPDCVVWTGPEPSATLYIPAPPCQDITVVLWVRGYIAGAQRDALRLCIDGRPATHRFEIQDGYRDVIAVDGRTTRDFIRLQIDTGVALASGTPGQADHDPRLRGLAFDSYGWSVR